MIAGAPMDDVVAMMRSWPDPLPPVAHSVAVALLMFKDSRAAGGSPQQCAMIEADFTTALGQLAWIESEASAAGIRSKTFDYDEYDATMTGED